MKREKLHDRSDSFSVVCNCGCNNGFDINFRFEHDDQIYIHTFVGGFYAKQHSVFSVIADRVRAAWFMLTGKEYRLHEIILTKAQYRRFAGTVLAFAEQISVPVSVTQPGKESDDERI